MAKPKTRKVYEPEFRRESVRLFCEQRARTPDLKAADFCIERGIPESLFSQWRVRFGFEFGDAPGRMRPPLSQEKKDAVAEVLKKDKTQVVIAKERGITLPTLQSWVSRYGERIKAEMGISPEPSSAAASETLISSVPLTKGGKRLGRPTNAERAINQEREDAERELARSGLGLSRIAFDPRPRPVAVAPPSEDDRQPELPFRAEPVRREEHAPEPQQTGFMDKVTAEALRERDAVLTTLKILMRDGGLPGQR